MDKIIDFTNAPDGFRDYGGSDSKLSKIYNGEYYMIKYADERIKKTEIDTSESNSIFSEYISSHIAQSMQLPCHDTKLGLINDEPVVACKDFVPNGYRLQEFDWFMRTVYRKNEIGRVPSYDQVYGTINQSRLSSIADAAIARYWNTFILDSLIGNFDRHKGNWGYLTNEKTGELRLAPIYDCGSSLYPALAERGFEKILNNKEELLKRIYDFPKAALCKNGNMKNMDKFGYYEMLSSGTDKNCTQALYRMAPKIDLNRINKIIDDTPFINNSRKNFYKEMIGYRKELIIDKALEICKNRENSKDKLFMPLSERFAQAKAESAEEKNTDRAKQRSVTVPENEEIRR